MRYVLQRPRPERTFPSPHVFIHQTLDSYEHLLCENPVLCWGCRDGPDTLPTFVRGEKGKNCYASSVTKILAEMWDLEGTRCAHSGSDPRHKADTKAPKAGGSDLCLARGAPQEGGSCRAQKEVQMFPWVPPGSGG